jgi:DNA repair exonuclease SbcCD ATPase subunit
MKKILLFACIGLLAISCNQEVEEENVRLKEENASLKENKNIQDTTLSDFVDAFEQVQQNLAEIRMREKSIREARMAGLEGSASAKDQILEDIEAINQLLQENKQTIIGLNEKSKKQSGQVYGLQKMVNSLRGQMAEKDTQIVVLKQSLSNANFKMEQLNAKVGMLNEDKALQRETIEQKTDELNMVYYAIGNADDLILNKVIDKEGGFIGIGRTKTLADDLNKEYFTRVDLRKTNAIPLEVGDDKVTLITPHPAGSYEITLDGDKPTALKILNAEEFWKGSRYLVIVVD